MIERSLVLGAFLLGALVMLAHRPFSQAEVGDTAIYDYIAQSVLRGQLPYRDVVDIKWPGAAYLSALSMLIGKGVGMSDVGSVRLLNVVLVGAFSSLIFLVARRYLRSRVAGVIAVLSILMIPRFGDWMTAGTQPKLPLIVFGMLSLLLLARDKPFWTGFTAMLACLCWQPGLVFVGVAVLIFSRYLSSWRDMRAVKAIIGAIVPFGIMLLYFYLRGALGDLWAWTITYNYSVFGPAADRGALKSLGHIWRVMNRALESNVITVLLSLAGLVLFLIERIRVKIKERALSGSSDLFRDSILFPPIIYFAFCLINFQSGPDLILLIPFVGIFAAKLVIDAGRLAGSRPKPFRVHRVLIPAAVVVLMFVLTMVRAAEIYRSVFRTEAIRQQREELKAISDRLGPDDKIYVHGAVEILVLLNRPNMNPYVFLDWGADDFAASRRGVPFQAIIDEMESEWPKIVALSRLKMVRHGDEFMSWPGKGYAQLRLPGYDGVYIRRELPTSTQ